MEITIEKLKSLGFKKMSPSYFAATCDVIGRGYEFKLGKYDYIQIWSCNDKDFYQTNSWSDNKKIENLDQLKSFMKQEFDLIINGRFEYCQEILKKIL